MTYRIRRLEQGSASDRAAIEAMGREVVDAGNAFVFEDLDGVRAYWFDPRGDAGVATDATGAVVGTYIVKPNQPGRGSHVANAGYMVLASARGGGLGMLLAEHSVETARHAGYRALQFNFVVASNAPALRLWEKLGMRIVGTLPAAFRRVDGGYDDAHVLYREL